MDDRLQKVRRSRQRQKHMGRNPRITKSILESENYHALHSRLFHGMHWFFSSRNIVIVICRSGRHRSVANAELWSNTLTRCRRHRHFVSLDFGENTSSNHKHVCHQLSVTLTTFILRRYRSMSKLAHHPPNSRPHTPSGARRTLTLNVSLISMHTACRRG